LQISELQLSGVHCSQLLPVFYKFFFEIHNSLCLTEKSEGITIITKSYKFQQIATDRYGFGRLAAGSKYRHASDCNISATLRRRNVAIKSHVCILIFAVLQVWPLKQVDQLKSFLL
jgi:hypothetical protein